MPHAVEMPSFLADDTGPMFSPSRPTYDLPTHLRQSYEKVNGNGRGSSHTSFKGSVGEGSDRYGDGIAKLVLNGDVLHDGSLNSVPNGRSSASSWDRSSSVNGSTLSVNGGINGGINGAMENGRKSPAPLNGIARTSYGDRNSIVSTNDTIQTTLESRPPTHGDNDSKILAVPPPISTHPQSTGPLTYTSSLVPASPQPNDVPTRAATTSPHRFSSPPAYANSGQLAPSQSSQSLQHPGSTQLKHRHTLQVPKPGPTRSSRDGEDAVYTSGRFSPTTVASGARRASISFNRRNTQSIHSNMPHEEVPPDEDAILWAEAVRQKRASKRKRKEEEDDDRVIVGTKVDQSHVNWVTAYNMLTGIRFTVSRTNAKMDRALTDADFYAKHKFSFDM